MANEKILAVVKGEEFRICVKDKIERTDIFYDQYVSAAGMLDDIVANRKPEMSGQWFKSDSENNIIAFCGERGEGKSSAMISFVNAAYKSGTDIGESIFAGCGNVKKTYFAEPIVMDPSMFDGVHNVLDIVLATLYRKFQDKYEEDNGCLERYQREHMLDQFQRVYKCISLINNQAKMLDDEYDYEGNIGKLSKLGESTRLRSEVEKLVDLYLKIMPGSRKEGKTAGCLLIGIDDLDLCSSNAYKMAEQIRKYLIIPNAVIIMAVKVEQLDLCVKEQNFKSFENIIRIESEGRENGDNGNNGFGVYNQNSRGRKWQSGAWDEVNGMSERYVAKLIPRVRRNYLPNVQAMRDTRILYKNRDGDVIYGENVGQTMNETILDIIYKKTGMKFLPDRAGRNCLLPDNLRDVVNMVALLGDMADPVSDEVYYENIQKFSRYYEKEWLFGNLPLEECREIQNLVYADFIHLHEGSAFALRRYSNETQKKYPVPNADFLSETDDCFWSVMSWIEYFRAKVFGSAEEKYAYAFHILYTIRLNGLLRRHAYDRLSELLGGYLWAGNFVNVVANVQGNGLSRSRFTVPTMNAYYVIYNYWNSYTDTHFPEPEITEYHAQKILKDTVNRSGLVFSWLILGMLSNTYSTAPSGQVVYTYSLPVVFDNYAIINYVHISLENYLVSLCNLRVLYDKLNMDLLGVGEEEFEKIISGMEALNSDKVDAARKIAANMDSAIGLKEFCIKHKESKAGGKDEVGTSEIAVGKFFKNAGQYVKENFGDEVRFDSFAIDCDGVKRKINISHLYALLVQNGVKYSDDMQRNTNAAVKERELSLFAAKLRERTEKETVVEPVSSFLKNKSADNARKNLDNLASNIRRYYSMHREERMEEPEIMELCDLYGRILDIYIRNPALNISDKMSDEYKKFYNQYQKTC